MNKYRLWSRSLSAGSAKIKRRFVYAAGIDEPICMIVEPDHQGWYGLDEFSTIAASWLCETQDPCYNAEFDFNASGAIDANDLFNFVTNYYLNERPLPTNTQYYGYIFDGMSNVVALTYLNDPNQTGDPNELPYFVETYSYTPFGEVTIYDPTGQPLAQSAIGNPYMFTAREYDPESGLYYYRLRMYSPTIGRFMQTDPIGYYDSMNLYQYCWNNPINWMDPWGLWTFRGTIAKGLGISIEFGRNSGQWSFGAQVGVGIGISAQLDFSDSGRRIVGLHGFAGANAAYGTGLYGGSGGLNLDTSIKKGNLNLGVSFDTPLLQVGPSWDIGYGHPKIKLRGPTISDGTINLFRGKSTGGLSVFVGGGAKYVW